MIFELAILVQKVLMVLLVRKDVTDVEKAQSTQNQEYSDQVFRNVWQAAHETVLPYLLSLLLKLGPLFYLVVLSQHYYKLFWKITNILKFRRQFLFTAKKCKELNIQFKHFQLHADTSENDVCKIIKQINNNYINGRYQIRSWHFHHWHLVVKRKLFWGEVEPIHHLGNLDYCMLGPSDLLHVLNFLAKRWRN